MVINSRVRASRQCANLPNPPSRAILTKLVKLGEEIIVRKNFGFAKPLAIFAITVPILAGCATTTKLGAAASVARTLVTPTPATSYNWTQILPKPPETGGARDVLDKETVRGFQSLQGSPRWAQATSDASLDILRAYSSVMGPDFTVTKRPEIVALLAYAGRQFSAASTEAKAAFPRPRPFLADPSLKVCVTDMPGGSSYPSGHAGWGWLSAQILARIETDNATAILARGYDYGLSRVICGVHYPSDVEAGRLLGDAMLAKLDGDPEYQRLLATAKAAAK